MLCFSSPSPAQGAGCYPGRCCFQELTIPIYFLGRFTLLDTSSPSDTLHSNRVRMNRAALGIFGCFLGSGERMENGFTQHKLHESLFSYCSLISTPNPCWHLGKQKSLPHLFTTRTSPRAAAERRENAPRMEQGAGRRMSSRLAFFVLG